MKICFVLFFPSDNGQRTKKLPWAFVILSVLVCMCAERGSHAVINNYLSYVVYQEPQHTRNKNKINSGYIYQLFSSGKFLSYFLSLSLLLTLSLFLSSLYLSMLHVSLYVSIYLFISVSLRSLSLSLLLTLSFSLFLSLCLSLFLSLSLSLSLSR